MTTDNRTNEPTEAMILSALNAYSSKGLEIDGYDPADEYPSLDMWGERFASQMRAALVAAQGAAPQLIVCDYCGDALLSVPSREHTPTTPSIQRLGFSADKVVCPECVQRARGAAPVLPSSGVDEDALAEVIGSLDWGYMVDGPSVSEIARAVAEWLKGQK